MRRVLSVLLIGALVLTGCGTKKTVEEKKPPIVTQKRNISLYFSDGSDNLVKEVRTVELNPGEPLEKRAVEELIKGPATKGLFPTIPASTKINSVNIENGTATLDFSEELITNHKGGSESENLTIYSIVNTMTDFLSINKVRFLINRAPRRVFKQMELEGDFERDNSLIKKQ